MASNELLDCGVFDSVCVCSWNDGHSLVSVNKHVVSCEWLFRIEDFSFMVQICERLYPRNYARKIAEICIICQINYSRCSEKNN